MVGAAMTAFAHAGPAVRVATETPTPVVSGRACDTSDNFTLVYARSTGRVPSDYCSDD